MNKIKVLTPKQAILMAGRKLREQGFFQLRSATNNDSGYYIKNGFRGRKIRISDHVMKGDYHADIAFNIMFTYHTIENDVDYQVKRAIQAYQKFKRVA